MSLITFFEVEKFGRLECPVLLLLWKLTLKIADVLHPIAYVLVYVEDQILWTWHVMLSLSLAHPIVGAIWKEAKELVGQQVCLLIWLMEAFEYMNLFYRCDS